MLANADQCTQWHAAKAKGVHTQNVPVARQPNGYDCGVIIVFEQIRQCVGLISAVPATQAELDSSRRFIRDLIK